MSGFRQPGRNFQVCLNWRIRNPWKLKVSTFIVGISSFLGVLFFVPNITLMNPLRSLAQFIVFLHSLSWTNKTSLIYQFIHFFGLVASFIAATIYYLIKYAGFVVSFDEHRKTIVALIFWLFVVLVYLLFFGKRPYLKPNFKNRDVVVGAVIWLVMIVYITFFIVEFSNQNNSSV